MSSNGKDTLTGHRISTALQRGAQDAQASLSLSETTDVSFKNNKLKSTQSAQRTEIQLKVIVDGKAGSSSSTDPADADGLVQRALESAQFGSPVTYQLPDLQPAQEVKLYDPALLALTLLPPFYCRSATYGYSTELTTNGKIHDAVQAAAKRVALRPKHRPGAPGGSRTDIALRIRENKDECTTRRSQLPYPYPCKDYAKTSVVPERKAPKAKAR